jgi:hypothetical protein
MALDAKKLFDSMLKAAETSLGKDWPKARDYARVAFTGLADALVDIAALAAAETINRQQAQALVRIHRNTSTMVLLTIEGLGIIAVENAVNAALKVLRDTVNKAAGFGIL